MFENAINSKKQGDIGMCYAMAYFSKIGYTVSVPITDFTVKALDCKSSTLRLS